MRSMIVYDGCNVKFSIGLTGGIGAGKSTVLEIFEESGFNVISADKICGQIYDDPNSEIHAEIEKNWGSIYIASDGKADKKMVAERVFSDDISRKWLNSKLHPEILRRGQALAAETSKKTVFEVPLLFETGWEDFFEQIIMVYTKDELRIERLEKRGLTRKEISERINAQMPQDKKLEKADFALVNNGSITSLKEQISKLIQQL